MEWYLFGFGIAGWAMAWGKAVVADRAERMLSHERMIHAQTQQELIDSKREA